MFVNGSGDRRSISCIIIPKTQKIVHDTSLPNTKHYKVWVKGKWSNPGKGVTPSPTRWCSSYLKGNLSVALRLRSPNLRGSLNKFPDFFIWALLLIKRTWNSSPLRSNLLWLQCTCTVPTTCARPHGSPLVWACQWHSSQPLPSPQLSHNDSLCA